jgi:hypothetical protein
VSKALDRKVEKAVVDLPNDDCWETVCGIFKEAARYWEGLDPNDFCLQHMSGGRIVFGSTNRLIWSPETGFYPDEKYCTKRFLNNFSKLKSTGH